MMETKEKDIETEVKILRKALDLACQYGNFNNGPAQTAAQMQIPLYGYFYMMAQKSITQG